MSNEDLKAKYGRKPSQKEETNTSVDNEETNASVNNDDNFSKKEEEIKEETKKDIQEISQEERENKTYTKKSKEKLTQKEKDIKKNIADVISKYTKEHQSISKYQSPNMKKEKESLFVRFIKSIVTLCILVTIACLVIAFIAKPEIDIEGDKIIEQIKKSENLYFSKMNKYYYFPKTSYDQTLGIDMSSYKYFTSYEVIPNEESGNYEAKLYGATNAFTITYYYLKVLMQEKGILE